MEKQRKPSRLTYFIKLGTKDSVQAWKKGKILKYQKFLTKYEEYCNQLGRKKNTAHE